MMVAVVHTRSSPCRCHEAVLAALTAAGIESRDIDSDSLPAGLDAVRGCSFAFDQTDTGDRHAVREALASAGLEIIGTPPPEARLLDEKLLAREWLVRHGIPVAPAGPHLGWPRVVKASGTHGSRGVRLVRSAEEESRARLELGPSEAVEEYVPGREVAVAVLGRRRAHALPPVEIRIPGPIYTSEDKWGLENPPVIRSDVSPDLAKRLETAYLRLGLRDFARFDLRVRPDGSWAILEVNVRPSLEPEGLLCIAASFEGWSPSEVVLGLLAGAGGPGRCPW